MATILLNESEPSRRQLLRTSLQRQGHKVWFASHLDEIVVTLHDVAIDLMILDLDHQHLEELTAFADRWKGIKILFQASSTLPLQDFRSWMADDFVYKFHDSENVARAVAQLLHKKSPAPKAFTKPALNRRAAHLAMA